jgi:hypothetical protein
MENSGLGHWRNTKALIVPILGRVLLPANQYSWRRVHNFIDALPAEDMRAKRVYITTGERDAGRNDQCFLPPAPLEMDWLRTGLEFEIGTGGRPRSAVRSDS